MGSIRDTINRLKGLVQDLNDNREQDLLLIAFDLKAAIASRIQNEGKDSEGNSLEAYSDRGVPAYLLYNKDKPSGGKIGSDIDEIAAAFGPYVSHGNVRQFYNRPIDITNLTFSGEMWNNTKPQTVSVEPERAVVAIRGTTQSAKDKLVWNSLRYGNVLGVSSEEERLIREAAEERIAFRIQQNGL